MANTAYYFAGLSYSRTSDAPTSQVNTAYYSAGLSPERVSGTTCTLSGTAYTDTIDEDDVVDGGKTIILTLSNDTWIT